MQHWLCEIYIRLWSECEWNVVMMCVWLHAYRARSKDIKTPYPMNRTTQITGLVYIWLSFQTKQIDILYPYSWIVVGKKIKYSERSNSNVKLLKVFGCWFQNWTAPNIPNPTKQPPSWIPIYWFRLLLVGTIAVPVIPIIIIVNQSKNLSVKMFRFCWGFWISNVRYSSPYCIPMKLIKCLTKRK